MSDDNMNPQETPEMDLDNAVQKEERERLVERREKRRKIISLIVSIIIAIVLWMYVINQENPTVDRTFSNVKVELINEDELADNNLAVKSSEAQYVKVTVTGRRSTLVDLESSDIVATADLSSCVSGENYLDVNINTPNMVELKKISPAQIKVDIDTIVSADRDVTVTFSGDAEEGYQPVATRQSYDSITITGAKQVLKKVTGISAKIKTSDLTTESQKITAELIPVDKNGDKVDNVTLSKEEMYVWAQLYEVKSVNLETSVTGTLDESLSYEGMDAPDTIKVAADPTIADSVTSVTAEPVDLSTITKDTYVDLTIDYPDGVVAADGYETVQAKISVSKITSKTVSMSTSDITVENLDSSLKLKFNSSKIQIVVSGSASALSDINKDSISLSIDASTLTEGEQSVNVTAKLKDSSNSEDVTINEAKTMVTVTSPGGDSGSA
ncbi:MAG: YbbR-like domain-containing protein [Anaerovoracaceae bacterium]|jgi:YbbR domain-containing protein